MPPKLCHRKPYLKIIIQKKYRSAYTTLRCRVPLINIKLEQNCIPVDQRLCGVVEDEYHALMDFNMCRNICDELFVDITNLQLDFKEHSNGTQFL